MEPVYQIEHVMADESLGDRFNMVLQVNYNNNRLVAFYYSFLSFENNWIENHEITAIWKLRPKAIQNNP